MMDGSFRDGSMVESFEVRKPTLDLFESLLLLAYNHKFFR